MLKRLSWRIQPVEQIKKRKQRKKEMWERHQQFVEFVEREKKKRRMTMTNGDWVAGLSDAQFIKWLRKYKYKTDACGLCEFKGKCSSEDCNECESLWLKQEHIDSNSI